MSFQDERLSDERDPLLDWPAFAQSVRARLEAGRAAYGDASFHKPPDALLGELSQEALDLAGWGFVLWKRIESMRAALQRSASEEYSSDGASPRGMGDAGRLLERSATAPSDGSSAAAGDALLRRFTEVR